MTKKKEGKKVEIVIVKRYPAEKLQFFKGNILKKLDETRKIINYNLEIMRGNENGTDDTSCSRSEMNDGKASATKEEAEALYSRGLELIPLLNNALIRIETGIYGICCETGEKIPEERLISEPHTTRSMEGKKIQEAKKLKECGNNTRQFIGQTRHRPFNF
jgi:DnaK suppressor protein